MTLEEALATLDRVLKEHLSDLQELVFAQVWQGQTYETIAERFGYDAGYIKDVASQLWKLLSRAFGEKVTRSNFRSVLRRSQLQQHQELAEASGTRNSHTDSQQSGVSDPQSIQNLTKIQNRIDWGEAIDVSVFYGRADELATLAQWIVTDHCRLITVLGMGGIGKTALAVKLAQQIQAEFESVIWRSLRNAPPLETLVVT